MKTPVGGLGLGPATAFAPDLPESTGGRDGEDKLGEGLPSPPTPFCPFLGLLHLMGLDPRIPRLPCGCLGGEPLGELKMDTVPSLPTFCTMKLPSMKLPPPFPCLAWCWLMLP